jgi:CubicO group peptidase (beta-lactamase class C family)
MIGRPRLAMLALMAPLAGGCGDRATAPASPVATDLPVATAASEGLDGTSLIGLAHWVRDNPAIPIFSVLISRHGKLVFELYTGGIDRSEAHYMMSVTKSVLSALTGVAIQRGAIPSVDTPISRLLPRALFPTTSDSARFAAIGLRQVMGMSALNVNDYPRDTSAAALAELNVFFGASNRVAYALQKPLVATPGEDFIYNDDTPMLAAGALQYATGKTLFDYGRQVLFDSLGFVNEEWMHQDAAGIDMGGYGFRMRPIDMQKFGILYLNGGVWNGKQLLPADWVQQSYVQWIKSAPNVSVDNYGWFWWFNDYSPDFVPGWTFLLADGLFGQRILINRDHDLVVTMTADIETGNESDVVRQVMKQFVIPAVIAGSTGDQQAAIDAALAEVRAGAPRFGAATQPRLIPSAAPKEQERPFNP